LRGSLDCSRLLILVSMKIKFVKLSKRWFVVLPDCDYGVDDLEMIGGAKDFLELLDGMSHSHSGVIELGIGKGDLLLRRKGDIEYDGEWGVDYELIDESGKFGRMNIWLCPVLKYVMGEYPEEMRISYEEGKGE